MIGSPHFSQIRLVIWLSSSRFASEARAVFESSPFLGIDPGPLSPIFCLSGLLSQRFIHNNTKHTCLFALYRTVVYHRGLCTVQLNKHLASRNNSRSNRLSQKPVKMGAEKPGSH